MNHWLLSCQFDEFNKKYNNEKNNLQVEGKTVLKFALCYGFRNLQNVVRKLKNGKSDYHYLEIMACPSGIFCSLQLFVCCRCFEINAGFQEITYSLSKIIIPSFNSNLILMFLWFTRWFLKKY